MADTADQVVQFNEYFKVIRNRLWVIFTILMLTVISGAYVTEEVLPKTYVATAEIQIRHRGEVAINSIDSGVTTDKPFDAVDFQSEFEIMQSKAVLEPVIQDLNLDTIWAKRVFKSDQKLSDEQALNYMTGSVLRFDFKRGTNLATITAKSEVKEESAEIANHLADQYKKMRDDSQDKVNDDALNDLRDQIALQQKGVDQVQATVNKIREDAAAHNVEIPMNGGGIVQRKEQELTDRKSDLIKAQEDWETRKITSDKLAGLDDDDFINTLNVISHENPTITSLRAQVLELESNVQDLLKDGFGENYPKVLALRAEIATMRSQIKDLVLATRQSVIMDVDAAKGRVDLLQQQVKDLSAEVDSDEITYLEPYREALDHQQQAETLLDALKTRLSEDLTDVKLMTSPVEIREQATIPENPTSNKGFFIFASALVGLFVGVGVAFIIEFLDTSVKTMADAESLLGLPVLTVIPNKGGPLPLTQEAARLPHAEGYRILRARLDLKVINGVGPSLSMLSGGPGEGKSTTIYNLAIVSAQAGQSVILVDCDLRRPTLHELVNLPNDRGLANYLRGEGDAVEYVQQTAIPKLHLLASGDMPMSEIGALAGDKIRAVLEDLKQRYDIVLVDSPPVLGISDGSIIAREVDYVILVIQHRRYPREISLRAKRAIEEVHGNCVGMVLNCVSVKSDDSYYYYSNYGNYYKNNTRKKKKKDDTKGKAKTNGKPVAVATSGRKKDLDSEEF